MKSRARSSAFTLLELVLVLVIIGTALGMAAPSLRGWSRGSRLRDTADQFLALTRLARSQAVASCQVHRLCLSSSGQYQLLVQHGEEFVPIASSFGDVFMLPEGYRIQLRVLTEGSENCIDFYPTGRTQPAHVLIISDQEETIELACTTPSEMFRLISAGEGP